MPKIKTRKSALKRFRKTPTGKFIRRKAFKGHLLEKKTSKRKKIYLGKWLSLKEMPLLYEA